MHFAEELQHHRQVGRDALHRRCSIPRSAAAAPAPLSPAGTGSFCAILWPTLFLGACLASSTRIVGCHLRMQDGSMLLCCLQSPFGPVQLVSSSCFQVLFDKSNSHLLTVVSLVLHEVRKYPEMCAVPPCSGTLYE